MNPVLEMAERRWLPDRLIRMGIRRLNHQRLRDITHADTLRADAAKHAFMNDMYHAPIAIETHKANEQHYELPPAFFQRVLGQHLKYSSGFWSSGTKTLDQAESQMLTLTCERAALVDNLNILELGCGWGSLSLWMAQAYPRSRIVSVSNSRPQKAYIESQIDRYGLTNLQVVTQDMNGFDPADRFDRVVSVEMFEHMRNWPRLLGRIRAWLEPGGKLFLHFFSHRKAAYTFEIQKNDDWMGRYFFTGGIMPSNDLLWHLDTGLEIEQHWQVDGRHYRQTAEAWLANLDADRENIMDIFKEVYGHRDSKRWFQRWRIFFMACAELFGYRDGHEWMVSHYRLAKE
jgi:cyclopropane-fatty-acyl-phospholipid synthase